MSIERNICGHEMGDVGELIVGSAASGGMPGAGIHSLQTGGRSGTYCLQTTPGILSGNNYFSFFPDGLVTGTTGTVTSGNNKRCKLRVYVKIVSQSFSFPTSLSHVFGFGTEAGTSGVWIDGNRRYGVKVGGGAVTLSSRQLSLGTWYQFVLEIEMNVSANTLVTATLTVTDDTAVPLSETVVATGNIGATDAFDRIGVGELRQSIFGISGVYQFDDWCWEATSNADAVSASTLPTSTAVTLVPPTGVATHQWETGAYTDVDEYPLNTADSMSSILGTGTEVEFTHASGIVLGFGGVQAMKLYVNAKIAGAGTGALDFMLSGAATSRTATTNYPTSSGSAANPNGGVLFSALSAASFSASTFGVIKQNGTQQSFIGNIGLEVLATAAAYGSGNQIRGETQIKRGSIFDAQIADAAAIQQHKIFGLGRGSTPVFFPEDEGRDDWMIPGPPGSAASIRIPVVPVFFPEDGEDAMLMAASAASSSGGGSTTNNYNTYLGSQVLLAELTAAASSSLDFATRNIAGQSGALFQADYDEYIVELINVLPATDNTDLLLRYSTDGGATYVTSAVYDFANLINNVANFQTPSVSGTGQTSSKIIPTQDNTAANGGACGSLKFFNPLSASQHKQLIGAVSWWNNDNQFYNGTLSFRFATTTAVNAFRMLYSSGNIASGTVRVYGLSKTAQSIQNTPAHGLALLHTQTVAAAATLDIVSRNVGSLSGAIFQSDYDEYVIELINLQVGTNDAGILGRVSTDGGATFSATTYARTFQYGAANNTTSGGGATGATSWDISGNQSNASTNCLVGFLKLYNPLSAALYKQLVGCVAWGHTGVDWISTEYSLIWKTITAINAFRLLTSSGTMTGTVRVYGVIKDATYPVSTIQTGTHASRPAVGNAGRIYLPNDGYSLGRDSGTAWETFGPFFPFTAPPTGVWSWLNQGTATITEAKDALVLYAPANGNTNDLKMREKVTPATPYTMTAYLRGGPVNKNNHQWGVFLRQAGAGTGTGRIMAFFNGQSQASVAIPGLDIYIADIAGATSAYGTFYRAVNIMAPVNWFRIADDGTNITFSISVDGQNWVALITQSRLTYLLQGPDRIGFFYHPSNSATPNLDGFTNVLSWKEA
jgi:hypothetical protein